MRFTLGLAILAMSVAPSGAAPTLLRVNKLEVHDSTGKRVADISPNRASRGNVVLRIAADQLIFLTLDRQEIVLDGFLFFPTTNCSGAPAIGDTNIGEGFYRVGAVAGPRRTVFVQSGPFSEQWVRSYLDVDGRCQRSSPFQVTSARGNRMMDLVDYFTPPFSLRAVAGTVVQPAAPEAAAPGVFASGTRLGVYDSRGTTLGNAEPERDPSTTVAFLTGTGQILIVEVQPDRLTGNADLYYESVNCTGRASLVSGPIDLAPLTAVIGARWTVWTEAGARQTRTVRSVRDDAGNCYPLGGPVTLRVSPAARAGLDLANYFSAPFSVRALGLSSVPPTSAAAPAEPDDSEE
jgi:hypothetical protein